jgi:hypothetical protein
LAKDTTVLGLFDEIDTAADGLKRLQDEAKREWRDVVVLSAAPFPEGVLQPDRSTSRLSMVTVVCALIGIVLGVLLAGGTALLYVIPQGGRPIVPGPPTAIIAYEVMMLCALSGAFARAMYEIRLPSWQARVYDERISEGLIGIGAHCESAEQAEIVEAILREAGAADVKRDARRLE